LHLLDHHSVPCSVDIQAKSWCGISVAGLPICGQDLFDLYSLPGSRRLFIVNCLFFIR
jgi:hypothetical protein